MPPGVGLRADLINLDLTASNALLVPAQEAR